MDIQCHEQPEALLQWVKDQFRAGFADKGLEVGIFTSLNDAAGTGLVYHVGDSIYRAKDPTMDLQTASDLIPDVAEQAHLAIELAQVRAAVTGPTPPSGG